MSDSKKDPRGIQGHYNYYGIPVYILKQKNGAYASGLYDPMEGVFRAGGSVKKVLWDGIKITPKEARKLISRYAKAHPLGGDDNAEIPDWILLPEEASFFIAQADRIRTEGTDILKNLPSDLPAKDEDGGRREV